jgi:preprotein translocase subunit SecE
VARQTRQQRKARRLQQQEAAAPLPQRSRARAQQAQVAVEQPTPQPVARKVPGGGAGRFIGESWGELRKVEWPGQKQVIQGTVVVLIACAIVGGYLWGADLVLKRFVQSVLLGQ